MTVTALIPKRSILNLENINNKEDTQLDATITVY
jgi:hypothetical protein